MSEVLADFTCPYHGTFEAYVEREVNGDVPDEVKCRHMLDQKETEELGQKWWGYSTLDCGEYSPWTPAPIRGSVQVASVERGKVAKPDSPMFLDTRELGEGMPMKEFKEKRRKLYEERRHKEGKTW